MDPSLRDTTTNSIARWKRRLEGQSGPAELALIAREADQLRGLALSHGAGPLAEHLGRIASMNGAPAPAIADAVRLVSEYMATQRASVAPPPTIGGNVSPSPVPLPALSMVGPPPLMMSRLGAPSIMQPSMLLDPGAAPPVAQPVIPQPPAQPPVAPQPPVAAQSPVFVAPNPAVRAPTRPLQRPPEVEIRAPARQPSKPPLAGTMLSGGTPSRNDLHPQAVAPVHVARPPAGFSPPAMQQSMPPQPLPPQPVAQPPLQMPSQIPPQIPGQALPPSVAPAVKPPKLLQATFLGFRAFGKVRPGGAPAAGGGLGAAPAPQQGLLGLQKHVPIVVQPPRIGRTTRTVERRGRPRPSQPDQEQVRVEIPRWFYFVGAAIVALGIVTVVAIVWPRGSSSDQDKRGHEQSSSASTATRSTTTSTTNGFSEVAPPKRANESEQLSALLETQRRMTLSCAKDPKTCNRWTNYSRDALIPRATPVHIPEPAPPPPLSGWLKSYKMPDEFPVRDEPSLKSLFDYMARNVKGHADFQNKLFECSAYQDIFDSTMIKYGVPHWLTAVAYQESACNRLATSQVGARGLWQFMPESARAYGLRVVDGEIDERLNPVKSTDAAMHFFTDLQRDLGSWDLALAAYNMGPYGVLARLHQVGEHATFWDLAHEGLLPSETAGYVPAIEAQAIIIENMFPLKFTAGNKALESTAEVIVKEGMRLGLIAHAASTSTLKIHDLNPEFLRDVVPRDVVTARVPDTQAHRAQAFLDGWSPSGDNRDTCVPADFDWGTKQFETSPFAKSCAQSAPTPGAP
jgi:Transglycosylase SLT domain